MPEHPSQPELRTFLRRAMRLRCPECGRARIFKPWRQSRTLEDWFAPLHGCPHCDYPYQREPGYFLAAICAVNYGVVCGAAIFASLCLDLFFSPPVWVYFVFIFAPMPICSFLFARHAKAIFLAIDHFIEPQAKSKPHQSRRSLLKESDR